MKLTSERLDVERGEQLRAVLVVHPSVLQVVAAGGLEHLRHELEDVGFRVLGLFGDAPAGPGWSAAAGMPTPSDLEWLLYAELEATRGDSFQRALTDDLRIARAWALGGADAEAPGEGRARVPHPYAVDRTHGTGLLGGRMLVFGVAYPLTREGSS